MILRKNVFNNEKDKKKNYIRLVAVSIENLKKLKYPALVLSIICSKRKNKNGKKNKDE